MPTSLAASLSWISALTAVPSIVFLEQQVAADADAKCHPNATTLLYMMETPAMLTIFVR